MIIMKLSTLLLSSAALLVAGAAFAADLPAKKAAKAAAATGCTAFGAGYIAIPGGDTCLKISGYVRSNNQYHSNVDHGTAPYSFAGAYGLQFDAASKTEIGDVKSTIFIENGATTDAKIAFNGFTVGKFDGPWDIGGGYNHTGDNMQNHVNGLAYAMPVGATTITVAAISAEDMNDGPAASRPDLIAFAETKAGALTTDFSVVTHEVVGADVGTAQGYAFLAKANYDAGVASLMGYAAYANGATKYLYDGSGRATNVYDSADDATNMATGTFYAGEIDVPVGKGTSIGLYAENLKMTQDVSSYSLTQYSVSLKHAIAKGLWIRPEIYQDSENGVISNGAYIRIQRDF
jgi:hypothetical protein